MSLVVILREMRRILTVTRIFRYLPLLVLALFCVQFASAQSTFDINMGFGYAHDSANKNGVDTNPALNLPACSSSTTSGNCQQLSSLSAFMLGVGGNLMLWKHFGVGASVDIQPSQSNYVNLTNYYVNLGAGPGTYELKDRVTFYNVDGIFQPYSSKQANVQILGGIGGANVKFYQGYSSTGSVLGNTNQSQYQQSANHFQVHVGAGVQVYVSGNFFVRPQVDIHYAPNMNTQFSSNLAWDAMVWVGYSIGNR
jgi:hypothetical protein